MWACQALSASRQCEGCLGRIAGLMVVPPHDAGLQSLEVLAMHLAEHAIEGIAQCTRLTALSIDAQVTKDTARCG
jgi:hypothetical protein